MAEPAKRAPRGTEVWLWRHDDSDAQGRYAPADCYTALYTGPYEDKVGGCRFLETFSERPMWPLGVYCGEFGRHWRYRPDQDVIRGEQFTDMRRVSFDSLPPQAKESVERTLRWLDGDVAGRSAA